MAPHGQTLQGVLISLWFLTLFGRPHIVCSSNWKRLRRCDIPPPGSKYVTSFLECSLNGTYEHTVVNPGDILFTRGMRARGSKTDGEKGAISGLIDSQTASQQAARVYGKWEPITPIMDVWDEFYFYTLSWRLVYIYNGGFSGLRQGSKLWYFNFVFSLDSRPYAPWGRFFVHFWRLVLTKSVNIKV